jgi:hypothetical protein
VKDPDAEGAPAANLVPARPAARRKPGPHTAAGKRRVRLNAVTHGLTMQGPVVPGLEQLNDWETHRIALTEALAPVGALETWLADRLTEVAWRLRRVAPYEAAALAEQQVGAPPEDPDRWIPESRVVRKLVRYESHLYRQWYHALHELEALQGRRQGRPMPLARVDVHGALPARSDA